MAHLQLTFFGHDFPELVATHFEHPLISRRLSCIRGKTMGAYNATGSFQWTKAVHGFAILVVRTKSRNHGSEGALHAFSSILSGERGSLASSLDYAITKQPLWLLDMFGIDCMGQPLVKRLFRRSNPDGKLPGPTAISLNHQFLPFKSIEVFWEGVRLGNRTQYNELLSKMGDNHVSAKEENRLCEPQELQLV